MIDGNEANDFYKFSVKGLANAHSYDEPDYNISNLKKGNLND